MKFNVYFYYNNEAFFEDLELDAESIEDADHQVAEMLTEGKIVLENTKGASRAVLYPEKITGYVIKQQLNIKATVF